MRTTKFIDYKAHLDGLARCAFNYGTLLALVSLGVLLGVLLLGDGSKAWEQVWRIGVTSTFVGMGGMGLGMLALMFIMRPPTTE